MPDSWDIDGDEVSVVLEEDNSVTPPRYRHRYALLVKNLNTAVKRSFFIASTEMKP
jgi:hypothetical protein